MLAKLRCQISIGQFSSERVVIVKSFNGREFSLFAQTTELDFSEPKTDYDSVEGWLTVTVVRSERNLHLIRLSSTTLESGQFLTVRDDQLKQCAAQVRQPA